MFKNAINRMHSWNLDYFAKWVCWPYDKLGELVVKAVSWAYEKAPATTEVAGDLVINPLMVLVKMPFTILQVVFFAIAFVPALITTAIKDRKKDEGETVDATPEPALS